MVGLECGVLQRSNGAATFHLQLLWGLHSFENTQRHVQAALHIASSSLLVYWRASEQNDFSSAYPPCWGCEARAENLQGRRQAMLCANQRYFFMIVPEASAPTMFVVRRTISSFTRDLMSTKHSICYGCDL